MLTRWHRWRMMAHARKIFLLREEKGNIDTDQTTKWFANAMSHAWRLVALGYMTKDELSRFGQRLRGQ